MIRIENLTKRFGAVRALNGLDLHVESGMVYGFLGPNGAGKTTTLRILSGLARADGGQAWIMGEPVGLRSLGQRPNLGVLPEEPAFYGWMTAREYLRDFVAPLYGIDAREAARRASELLERIGLKNAADRRIGGFSRGMRQRLGLAQALIHRPQIMLLDEPVSALDPAGRREVLELIEDLRGETTILLSTHILADVERVCDVIGIINQGRMVIESERQALLEQYALPVFEVETDANGDRSDLGEWDERLRGLPYVDEVQVTGHVARLRVRDVEVARHELLAAILATGLPIRRLEVVTPSLEDVFLQLTGKIAPEQ